jgi:outer membrane protein OmpA-like peptidoglycan-associated protein
MNSRVTPLIAGVFAIFATQALAQGANPSADQIIKSLTPTGDVSKTGTRGIRLSQPNGSDSSAYAPLPGGTAAGSAGAAAKPSGHAKLASSKPMTAAGAQSDASPAVNLTVNFPTGSADLTAEAMKTLDALGTALSSDALSHYKFRVEGHTDTVGSPESNKVLSQRRAQAVVNYISAKFNIDESRMQPVGMGESDLLVKTGQQVPEERNRRVQVINLGA